MATAALHAPDPADAAEAVDPANGGDTVTDPANAGDTVTDPPTAALLHAAPTRNLVPRRAPRPSPAEANVVGTDPDVEGDHRPVPHSGEPAPERRHRRALLGVMIAVLLVAAVAIGIRSTAGGDDNDAPARTDARPGGTTPAAAPTTATTPTGPVGLGGAVEPCAAVDDAMRERWGLSAGQAYRPDGHSRMVCSWTLLNSQRRATADIMLVYQYGPDDTVKEPEPSPISLAGLPSPTIRANSYKRTCEIAWSTTFGSAFVNVYRVGDGPERDLCGVTAEFTDSVAGRVPK
ncbi:hypothetical protein [Embleya sp. NPDC001921]